MRKRLILTALVLLSVLPSCYLKERLTELIGPSQEESSQLKARGKSAQSMTVDCCWCYLSNFHENEINPYAGKATCEDMDSSRNAICKKIKVLGNSCSFLEVSGRTGVLDCDVRPIKYLEGGKVLVIDPPEGEVGPCYQEKLVRAKGLEALENPEKGKKKVKCSWVCGQDPVRETNCYASVFQDGGRTSHDSIPRPGEGTQCDSKTCIKMFGEKYYQLCPAFDSSETVGGNVSRPRS